jgi:predicted small lipoprotein YifL
MKTALALTAAAIAAGCGQTGALYLPDQGVETPVEIRAPAPQDEPDEEKKDEKATQPQGR